MYIKYIFYFSKFKCMFYCDKFYVILYRVECVELMKHFLISLSIKLPFASPLLIYVYIVHIKFIVSDKKAVVPEEACQANNLLKMPYTTLISE